MCTRDFSRVFFAAELSTKLVYKCFVKDYDYILYHKNLVKTVKNDCINSL